MIARVPVAYLFLRYPSKSVSWRHQSSLLHRSNDGSIVCRISLRNDSLDLLPRMYHWFARDADIFLIGSAALCPIDREQMVRPREDLEFDTKHYCWIDQRDVHWWTVNLPEPEHHSTWFVGLFDIDVSCWWFLEQRILTADDQGYVRAGIEKILQHIAHSMQTRQIEKSCHGAISRLRYLPVLST